MDFADVFDFSVLMIELFRRFGIRHDIQQDSLIMRRTVNGIECCVEIPLHRRGPGMARHSNSEHLAEAIAFLMRA